MVSGQKSLYLYYIYTILFIIQIGQFLLCTAIYKYVAIVYFEIKPEIMECMIKILHIFIFHVGADAQHF